MAQGVKRSSQGDSQAKSKKSRAASKKGQDEGSSPQKGSSVTGVGEDDDTVIGTQDFRTIEQHLAAIKQQEAKQEDWPKEFGKKLDEKEADVLKKLEGVKTKLDADKASYETKLVDIFEAALSPIDSAEAGEVDNDPVIHISVASTTNQTFVKNLDALIEDCHALTYTYHTLAEITSPQSSLPKLESDLQLDKAAITNSIAAARKLVQRDVEGMLADSYHEQRGRSNLTAEDEVRGRALMSRAKKGEEKEVRGLGFGETARALEKIARKMEDVGRREVVSR